MQNLGILLIDMQENFINGNNPLLEEKEMARLVEAQIRFLNIAKRKQIPVFTIEYENRGKTILKLQEILRQSENYIIKKKKSNGFNNPELSPLLKGKGIKNLILTGIYSNVCIRETAEGAKNEGFNVLTCRELVDIPYECYVRWYRENTDYSQKLDELLRKISNPNL